MRYNLAVIVTISFMQNIEVLALSTCFYITYIWTIKSDFSRWFKKHFEISCGVQSYDQGLNLLRTTLTVQLTSKMLLMNFKAESTENPFHRPSQARSKYLRVKM